MIYLIVNESEGRKGVEVTDEFAKSVCRDKTCWESMLS